MTKKDALKRVASTMALNTFNHKAVAEAMPNLKQNTQEACEANLEACKAIGIELEYRIALDQLNMG